MTPLRQHLASLPSGKVAREWAGYRTASEAWEQCERSDRLIWWAAMTPANSRSSVLLTLCSCARLALRYVPLGKDRPRLAIEAAERWVAEPTEENRIAADAAGWAAEVYSEEDHESAEVIHASRAAANTAYAAADVVADAAMAARAIGIVAGVSDAAEAAAEAAAGAAVHRQMCTIIRARLVQPWRES